MILQEEENGFVLAHQAVYRPLPAVAGCAGEITAAHQLPLIFECPLRLPAFQHQGVRTGRSYPHAIVQTAEM